MKAALFLLLITPAAFALDADVLRCRALKDPPQRLACYDAMTVPAVPAAGTVRPESRETPAEFGLDTLAGERRLDAIDSHIEGRFEGWNPKDKIRLANGQVWQISDDSRGFIDKQDPKVRVRRGALGAYYLEFEGSNRSPKIRRVQ
ncbi:hypothetical protein HLB44_34675 [Aquincola sp. S2]|uniref:Uncharacterized protein n=1 Tax=Pseudaquabacterium terrae TaxID=2732868 RepID=A0ABX2EUI4_9BURK|nr:hypothetical protein [Aquabacterium terrae]NRF72142.1 hypothetical protein [Aquabacterium terrae]